MHGSIIGMVPKHFIITLIEYHCWYEYTTTAAGFSIEDAYKSSVSRSKHNSMVDEAVEAVRVDIDSSSQLFSNIEKKNEMNKSQMSMNHDNDSGEIEVDEVKTTKINQSNDVSPHVSDRMKGTMAKFTGEADLGELPMTRKLLPWYKFNVDFWSNQR